MTGLNLKFQSKPTRYLSMWYHDGSTNMKKFPRNLHATKNDTSEDVDEDGSGGAAGDLGIVTNQGYSGSGATRAWPDGAATTDVTAWIDLIDDDGDPIYGDLGS